MKSLALVPILILAVVFYCCKDYDENPPRVKGKIAFSPKQVERVSGRINEQAKAAFMLLSIRDSEGNTVDRMKLSLFTLGQGYTTENFEMETGNYYLTEFIVLDSSSNVIYATPQEGSGLSEYVDDPLPIEFQVGNGETLITPQVLAVESTDDPEMFGLVSFGFDVAPRVASLSLRIHYPDPATYDSAYIVFKNSGTEIKQRLVLNNSTYLASGAVTNLLPGSWHISVSFFSTIQPNYESLEKNAAFTFDITSTATDVISFDGFAFIKAGKDLSQKTILWEEYYYYQLYLKSTNVTTEGFVRLPTDPTNPFVEIRTFEQKWIYAYADRSFYNSSVDGTSNHYQGGGAFEIYGQYGGTHDRLHEGIIDTTSLANGISDVSNKIWNFADCVIIIEGAKIDQELLLYHVWDFRPSDGRINTTLDTTWSKKELQRRKQIHRR